jgi:hypothetical protein
MMNPPLASFWLALAGTATGWNEPSIHLWMLVPSVLALVGVWRLAEDLDAPGWLAALVMASTPGFFVSSTTVMCDIPMLAAWVWSVSCWLRGMRQRRHALLAAGAVLAAVSGLNKYFGLAVIPLLFAYSLSRERRVGSWAAWLLVPLAIVGAYEAYSAHLYGGGLVGGAADYAVRVGQHADRTLPARVLTTLAFAGGCYMNVGLLAPRLWSRRTLLAAGAAATVISALFLAIGSIGLFPLVVPQGVRWAVAAQAAIFAVIGVGVIVLAVEYDPRARSAESHLLLLWVAGTLVFAGWVNWSTNARAVLPLAPVVAILLARRLAPRDAPARLDGVAQWWPHVAAGALALALGLADQQLARNTRDAAVQLASELKGRTPRLWFQGHWGFQYYAEQLGLVPLDYERSTLRPGELMVVPATNSKAVPLPGEAIEIIDKRSWPPFSGLTTWDRWLGAGFYSDRWGPLPYAFGVTTPEYYAIVRVTHRIDPEPRRAPPR